MHLWQDLLNEKLSTQAKKVVYNVYAQVCKSDPQLPISQTHVGRHISYSDETWVNAGHTKEKVWEDANVVTREDAFLEAVEKVLPENINVVMADKWHRACFHVQRIEKEFWQRNGITDASLDRLEISLVSDTTSESDASDSEVGGMEEPL
ncbi:hypothetical protein HPB49_013814 [Dermacentor silvarum]|uniref:Uncharacterized protein n=1 Tax=Dermacentor silvarum TaxID=543639 RepID=A0ACB8D5T3_DERSI|nr:hypothetical protein HPB49_013814 [Dermacentor silvarum]